MMKRLLVSLLISGLLGGCASDDMSDLKAYVDDVKQRRAGRIEPLPEIKHIETYAYSSTGLRNPFAPVLSDEVEPVSDSGPGLRPDFNRRKEELEYFPLDTLRMVGTLEKGDSTWGLVRANDGTIYRVQPGNYLGQNHGKISRVFEDRIELTELIQDGQGGYMERQATLALGEE